MGNLPSIRKRVRPTNAIVPFEPQPSCNPLHDNRRVAHTYVDPASLLPPERALRKTNKRHMAALKASISEFGFIRPLLVDQERRIIAGNNAWVAAKELSLAEVPIVQIEHLTPDQIRLYRLMDNKSAELSVWDDDLLKLELAELTSLTIDYDLNVELSGFATAEIDKRLHVAVGDGIDGADKVPAVHSVAVTALGDMWQLGVHRVLSGSALEEECYVALLGDERAQMVFSDVPYNVKIGGNVSGLGKRQHREFAMASGEMSREEFTAFLTNTFRLQAAFSIDGSIHFQCIDWKHLPEMLAAGHAAYDEWKNLNVWVKDNAGMGSFYRSQHELVLVWKKGTAPHINNFGLGETGRHRSNVWNYAGCNSFGLGRDEALASHPTVKPLGLVADAIRDCSKRGGIILDAFGGSGTTLLGAELTGRKARLIELDPLYCDVIIRRWQKRTGQDAVHIESGLTFDELADERGVIFPDEEA